MLIGTIHTRFARFSRMMSSLSMGDFISPSGSCLSPLDESGLRVSHEHTDSGLGADQDYAYSSERYIIILVRTISVCDIILRNNALFQSNTQIERQHQIRYQQIIRHIRHIGSPPTRPTSSSACQQPPALQSAPPTADADLPTCARLSALRCHETPARIRE